MSATAGFNLIAVFYTCIVIKIFSLPFYLIIMVILPVCLKIFIFPC